MNYIESIDFINSLINYEKKFANYNELNYDPQKIKKALDAEKIVVNSQIFHIAGTKGKGSTSIYLAELIYRHTNENTGLYTSPHIERINERIVVNGKEITNEEFAELVSELKDKFNRYDLTFFEALTFMAMIYFNRKGCKYIVLETGLGGRLDATNFCLPVLSIITPISYDHTDVLGKTLSKIAFEKAGIIKQNIPVLSAGQRREALKVLKNVAKDKNSPFFYLPELVNYKINRRKKIFKVKYKDFHLKNIKFVIPSDVFIDNFILSLTAFKLHFKDINKYIIEDILKLELPYRMKVVKNFLFDVAHNDDSIKKLFQNIIKYRIGNKEKILLLGILSDKELSRIARIIKSYRKIFKRIILFDFKAIRDSGSKELFNLLKNVKNVEYIENLENLNFEEHNFYVVTGSFYIMKYVEDMLRNWKF
ncbi:MAG: Mur ligase family protein [Brevinematales bacterium]|nr:Mur ligase family protein [Brevinematales bacterium]